ncbi:LysR family transcriptional regulator [Neokomagataea thailandica]|uniref:LysR family transcriptional regulator n=1 Tax=Neokomagataea tanensis NBRC 106556 TaxID=1223519 RepID=A0ABQ0QJ41_9PROT|nr:MULTISPECIES: LysR family transcriptional regulator [Neokomagataea]GBR46667.1 LysR family transcriptional regulator [Neokomagataea tanensis NBRC 106556]
MDKIDWHLWQSFAAAYHAGSLSGAAQALGTTQPTVSRQIHQLEIMIGQSLFSRSRSGLVPTDHARALMPMAASMTNQAHALERLAKSASATQTTTLTITASQITGTMVLPSILVTFLDAHPALRITLSLNDTVENVLERDADIAVRHTEPTQQELWGRKIGFVPIKLYAHKDYVSRYGFPSDLPELSGHRLIASSIHLRRLTELGLQPTFECSDDAGLLAALQAGVGVGYCQAPVASEDPNLVPILPDYIPATLPFWIVTHRDLRGVPAVHSLMQHLGKALDVYCRRAM